MGASLDSDVVVDASKVAGHVGGSCNDHPRRNFDEATDGAFHRSHANTSNVVRTTANSATSGTEEHRNEVKTATPPVAWSPEFARHTNTRAWSPPILAAGSQGTGAVVRSAAEGCPRIGRDNVRHNSSRSMSVPSLNVQAGLRSEGDFPNDEGAFGPRYRGLSPEHCRSPRMPVTAVARGEPSPRRNETNAGSGRGVPRRASRSKISTAVPSRTTSTTSGAVSTPS